MDGKLDRRTDYQIAFVKYKRRRFRKAHVFMFRSGRILSETVIALTILFLVFFIIVKVYSDNSAVQSSEIAVVLFNSAAAYGFYQLFHNRYFSHRKMLYKLDSPARRMIVLLEGQKRS